MSWIRFSVSYGEGFICLYMPVTKLTAADEWGHYMVYWLRRWCVQPTEHQWPTPNSPLTNWKPFLACRGGRTGYIRAEIRGRRSVADYPLQFRLRVESSSGHGGSSFLRAPRLAPSFSMFKQDLIGSANPGGDDIWIDLNVDHVGRSMNARQHFI